ncbi:MAG TPA: SPOR domain-containing protein [Pseudomonadales bacterium]|nr:SPOR domain-containing protein [Pseudomonadales bacterium]
MKREASSSSRKKKPARKSGGVPSWLWLLIGTLAGGFIMFLVYISGVAPQLPNLKAAPKQAQHSEVPPASNKAGSEPAAPPKRTSPVFEFYTKLPEGGGAVTDAPPGAQPQNVQPQNTQAPNASATGTPVPNPSATTPAQPTATATTTTAPSAATPAVAPASQTAPAPQKTEALDPIQQLLAQQEAEKNKSAKPEKKAEPEKKTEVEKKSDTTKLQAVNTTGKLYLQAGVFRNRTEADKLRAKIASLGFKPSSQNITNHDGETLQKILIGPFNKKTDMDEASIILTGNKINVFPAR